MQDILNKPAEERVSLLFKHLKQHQVLWTLADDIGAVMFNSDEEEDCMAVWTDEKLAVLWCTEEWADCKPIEISLEKWQKDWLPGLEADEVSVLVMPNQDDEGLVLAPWEFAEKLAK